MPELAAFLEGQHADAETIQQATRYLVAELDPADPADMRSALLTVCGPAELDRAIEALTRSPEAMQNSALFVLSEGWADPTTRDMITRIVPDARGKLPVIEAALLALAVMYGLYLFTTKGVTRAERTIERRADGSYVEREITEYHHPAEVLKVLPRLLPGSTPAPPAEEETP